MGGLLCDAILGAIAKLPAGAAIAVACSGGRDSMALLHAAFVAVSSQGREHARPVHALHVHHGLSPRADDWAAHVEQVCMDWRRHRLESGDADIGPHCHVHRLHGRPAPGESVEAWARAGRYRALEDMAVATSATIVLLAHHRRDQAETFLLQALRGGARGLAGMPVMATRGAVVWARPWLALPRDAIEAYVAEHKLSYVEDESNLDVRYARNRLRHQVWGALTSAFPQAESSLAHAARLAGQANDALAELAAMDLAGIASIDTSVHSAIDIMAWARLSTARRVNVLHAWLERIEGRPPTSQLLLRLADELPEGGGPATWQSAGGLLRRYRGRLSFEAAPRVAAGSEFMSVSVSSQAIVAAPAWNGELVFTPACSGGVANEALHQARLAPRQGGEQFQSAAGRPPRSLKKQFQAAAIPAWERDGPLLYAGDRLLFVPGLGIDARAIAAAGEPQMSISWRPAAKIMGSSGS